MTVDNISCFYSEVPDPEKEFLIYIIVGTVAAALASLGMIFVTYTVTKRHVEKKLKSSLESLDISQDSCQVQRLKCLWLPFSARCVLAVSKVCILPALQHVLINKEPSNDISVKAFPPSPPSDYEPHLPDCVPMEIKSEYILYYIVEQVLVILASMCRKTWH